MATAHLVVGSTLTFWIPGQTPLPSTSSYSSIVQSARLLVYLLAANLRLISINTCHMMTTLFNCSNDQVRASHGGQNEDKTLLQRSQHCHKGEFWHVSINAWQRSLQCGQNLCGPFLRATLPMTVESSARAMAINGKTKALRTPPPRWVSAQLLYVCVSAW